jgi:hypothetical protein
LAELDRGLEQLPAAALPAPRQINREWIEDQLQTLRKLVARDAVGARRKIPKHIDDLRIAPAPDVGERVVRLNDHGSAPPWAM